MNRRIGVVVLACTLGACGASESEPAPAAEEMTRAQRDSVIAESPLPGAGVVGAALDASERASERATAHDTIR